MKLPRDERFPRNKRFDEQFEKVPNLRWYPYVGQKFEAGINRVMVFAHNIPIKPADCEAKLQDWKAKDAWADAKTIGEYTYCHGWWTKTFRSFVKSAVELREDYFENSNTEITDKIDEFINRISYINFIQDLVRSENQIANAESDQIEMSKEINREILRILGVTHCICWGKQVYNHLLNTSGYRIIEQKNLPISGFATAIIEANPGRFIKLLKVFHPSMPSFRPFSAETQAIISKFLNDKD
jgi:hypothetical protein